MLHNATWDPPLGAMQESRGLGKEGERPMTTRTQYMGYTYIHRVVCVYVFALIFGMAHKSIFRTLIARQRRRRRQRRHVAFFLFAIVYALSNKQTQPTVHTHACTDACRLCVCVCVCACVCLCDRTGRRARNSKKKVKSKSLAYFKFNLRKQKAQTDTHTCTHGHTEKLDTHIHTHT